MRTLGVACGLAVGAALAATNASAQDLVFTPVNPSFGGSPLNSGHLLGIANAQNNFSAPPRPQTSQADRFRQQLESRILSSISARITDVIFGEDAPDEGRFQFDGQLVEFLRTEGAVRITLTDTVTGGVTVIEVPDVPEIF